MQESKAANRENNGSNGIRGHSVKGTSPSTLFENPSTFGGFYGNQYDATNNTTSVDHANLMATQKIWAESDTKARTSTVAITPTRYTSSLSPP